MRKQGADAEGKDVGEMFEYDIKQKITIGKNQSALVPILQSHIDVEKVSLWSATDNANDSDDDDEGKPSQPCARSGSPTPVVLLWTRVPSTSSRATPSPVRG